MINKKRLTKTGSICIPKFMRMEQGLSRNTALELVAKDNGDQDKFKRVLKGV